MSRALRPHVSPPPPIACCPSVLVSTVNPKVEEYLAKVVQLFSYLTDKDLFAEIYRNQLARRLLNSRSASDDMERLMIGEPPSLRWGGVGWWGW